LCALIPFDTEHVERVRSWILHEETRELLGTVSAPSDVEHRRWFDELHADPNRETRLIQTSESNEVVGVIGLLGIERISRGAELWVYLGEEKTRRAGLGREAVWHLLRYAFDTLGLERVFVRVMAYNPDAHSFFRSIGFTDEGTLRSAVFRRGRFHDVFVLSILRAEYAATRDSGVPG
jgi:RimJ/RimL family protein N-acetyltransferase